MQAIPKLHLATHAIALFIANIPDAEVNQPEAHILAFLHEAGPSRINDIHAAFGHRRSTLTSVLDRLEKRKLIKRSMDPHDRRAIQVTLTTSGKSLAVRVFKALSRAEDRVLKRFSASEVNAFERITEAFGELEQS